MFQLFELFNPDTTSVKCAIYPWVRHLFISPDFSVPVFEHFGPGKKAEFEPATIGIGSANLPEDDSAELMALQLEVAEMAQEMTDKMSGMYNNNSITNHSYLTLRMDFPRTIMRQ